MIHMMLLDLTEVHVRMQEENAMLPATLRSTPRSTRIRKAVWIGTATVALLIVLIVSTRQQLSSQGNDVTEIGLGAYQFVGRIDQNGTEFTSYGYLYDIQGVPPGDLFSDPLNASEATAHFTYYATATLSSRAILTDAVRGIFAIDSVGEITYYYQETPYATFDDPESFALGTSITTASTQLQDILTVQGPNRGLATANGEFVVLTATPFTLNDETVRFGRSGRVHRISTFGDAVRTDAVIPQSSVLLAGSAVDSGSRQAFLPYVTNSNGRQ